MFEKLICLDLDWKKIGNINDVPENERERFKDALYECLEECKGIVRKGNQDVVNTAIKKEISNEDFQKYIQKILDKMMFGYRSMEPLRNLQEKDIFTIYNFVNDLFEYNIIRNDLSFTGKFREYGLESEESMSDILLAFRSLVRFYVINRYTVNSIVTDFSEETGLSEAVSRIVAEIIEKNYNQLQMTLLLMALAEE